MLKVLFSVLSLFGVEVEDGCFIMVETYDGQVFEAGSGSTCQGAMQGAVYPDDWRSIYTEKGYLVRLPSRFAVDRA